MHFSLLILLLLVPLLLTAPAPIPRPDALAAANPLPVPESKKHKAHEKSVDKAKYKKPQQPKSMGTTCRINRNTYCNDGCYKTFENIIKTIKHIDGNRMYRNGEHVLCEACKPGYIFPNWLCMFIENSPRNVSGELILQKTMELSAHNCQACGQTPLFPDAIGTRGMLKIDIVKDITPLFGHDDHTGTNGHSYCRGLCPPPDFIYPAIAVVGVPGAFREHGDMAPGCCGNLNNPWKRADGVVFNGTTDNATHKAHSKSKSPSPPNPPLLKRSSKKHSRSESKPEPEQFIPPSFLSFPASMAELDEDLDGKPAPGPHVNAFGFPEVKPQRVPIGEFVPPRPPKPRNDTV